jgi:hypothetical protein
MLGATQRWTIVFCSGVAVSCATRWRRFYRSTANASNDSCCVASTIRRDAARVWVEWEDLQLPAGVHCGAHVAVIGNLKTFNVGGGFHVVKACLLAVSPQAMIRAALDKYPDAVIKKIRPVMPRKVDDGTD